MIIRSLLEALAVILVIVGFLNEEKLVAFEDRVCRAIRSAMKRKGESE